jgi:hypothetical protein
MLVVCGLILVVDVDVDALPMELFRAWLTDAGNYSYHSWQDEEAERWSAVVLFGAKQSGS